MYSGGRDFEFGMQEEERELMNPIFDDLRHKIGFIKPLTYFAGRYPNLRLFTYLCMFM